MEEIVLADRKFTLQWKVGWMDGRKGRNAGKGRDG